MPFKEYYSVRTNVVRTKIPLTNAVQINAFGITVIWADVLEQMSLKQM